jgi:hypothetical protein
LSPKGKSEVTINERSDLGGIDLLLLDFELMTPRYRLAAPPSDTTHQRVDLVCLKPASDLLDRSWRNQRETPCDV